MRSVSSCSQINYKSRTNKLSVLLLDSILMNDRNQIHYDSIIP